MREERKTGRKKTPDREIRRALRQERLLQARAEAGSLGSRLGGRLVAWARQYGVTALLLVMAGFCTGYWLYDVLPQQAAQTAGQAERLVPIYFVETEEKTLAISFDAAWGCAHTQQILDALEQHHVTATFFLTNIWLDQYPDMAKKIAEAGHEIGMHSASHPHMNQLNQQQIVQELADNHQRIVAVTGQTPRLFRFPFGEYSNDSIRTVRQQGYYDIQWSIDSLDWCEEKTTEDIVNRVVVGLHPGAIILCHNNGPHTAEAIAQILSYAQQQGYTFVPVGELIYQGEIVTDHQGMQKQPAAYSVPSTG